MPWDPFLMIKFIKNEICESVNTARMYCSRKTGQKLRLLFMYRTWTVTASGRKRVKKKKKKKKGRGKHRSKTQTLIQTLPKPNQHQNQPRNSVNAHNKKSTTTISPPFNQTKTNNIKTWPKGCWVLFSRAEPIPNSSPTFL